MFKTTNYARGRNYEYRVRDKLRKEGWIVLRTSGSHGFCDLVAFKSTPSPQIKLIQCKLGGISENQKKKLREENYMWNGLFNVSFDVV